MAGGAQGGCSSGGPNGAPERVPNADAPGGAVEHLQSSFDTTLQCLAQAWPAGYPPAEGLARLRDRLMESHFQLAVLGQFKRGKSTFINALLGAAALPAAVVPLTAIATFIAWGAYPLIKVTYQGGRPPEEVHPTDLHSIQEQIRDFVAEERNPANVRRVSRVDLFLPAEILENGLVLIDTPGIGSTLQHNTDTALRALPECDAAMFVVSPDPPITEAEITYLARVRTHVVNVFFVLNKIDYLDAADRASAAEFLRKTVHAAEPEEPGPAIFQVSARQALDAKLHSDQAALEASGLKPIEQEIVRYLAREKATALRESVRRKACDLIDEAIGDLHFRIRALEMPFADLERRAALFAQARRGFESERRSAQDLLAGDRKRAESELEAHASRLRQEGQDYIVTAMQHAITENGGVLDEQRVHHAVAAAIPTFFEARLDGLAEEFRRGLGQILSEHQARTDNLVSSVRQTAADLFDVPFREPEPSDAFQLGPEPYWVTQETRTVLVPSPAPLFDRILPAGPRMGRIRRRLGQEIERLVQRNVENLRWATLRGLNETFRRFGAQLDQRLAQSLAVTQGVIEAALERRQARAGEIEPELVHLRGWLRRMECCRRAFECGAESPQ